MAEAKAKIGIEDSGFHRSLAEMRSGMKAWAGDLKGTIAGVFAFGAVASWFTNFRTEMGRVQDLADRFGQSVKAIQQVGNEAAVSGSDLEQVATILTKLTLQAAEAADKFEAVGISASDFVSSGFDQQILMLAQAWEEANGHTDKQIALMQLLGTKGQDLMPMLSKGVQQLRKDFAEVPTVADAAVASMSRFNDFIDRLVQKSHQAAGSIVGLMQMTGDFFKTLFEGGTSKEMGARFEARLAEYAEGPRTSSGTSAATIESQAKAKEEQQKKTAEAAAALDDELLKLQRSRMADAEKVKSLEAEKSTLASIANDQQRMEDDRLTAAKNVLVIQQEIEKLQKDMAAKAAQEAEKEADKAKRKKEGIIKAEQALADEQNRQTLQSLKPGARIDELKKQQADLYAEASKLQKKGDKEAAAEKRLDALRINDDIASAQKELDEKTKGKDIKDNIISSSLGAIGGGGGVYVNAGADPSVSELRRHTSLLERIAANTSGVQGGPLNSPF